jgi:endo-1,4-beta-xylanase
MRYIRIIFTFIILAACVQAGYAFASVNTPIEILTDQYNWKQFSGTSWEKNRLRVIPLDRKIRPKFNPQTKWYLNPPINLSGPRLDLMGDFYLSIGLDASAYPKKTAFIDLYGTLPIIFDEWRIDGRNIRLGLTNGLLEVWVNMVKQPFSKAGLGNKISLNISRKNSIIYFGVDGETIGTFQETIKNPLFQDAKIYFGVDAELGGGFTITNISEQGAIVSDNYTETIKKYEVPDESLRALAQNLKRPILMATAANMSALASDINYGKVLAENFSMITPEFDFKFQAIHPRPDQYAFAEADTLVDFANKNNIKIHGHTLVWHEALPEWIWKLYKNKNYKELHSVLMNHISTIVSRYKGRIIEWDTLNEIFTDDSTEKFGLRSNAEEQDNISIWYKAFGIQIYIDALKQVKQIDPHCENWINEFGINQDGSKDKLTNVIAFANYVNSLGYGRLVDGIGFQSHNYEPYEDPDSGDDLLVAMKRVMTEAHIKARVSELDVNEASDFPGSFSDKLTACLELNCSSFSMWGFTDRYGSMAIPINRNNNGTNYFSPNWGAVIDDALIFDENYNAKKSYELLKAVLKSFY